MSLKCRVQVVLNGITTEKAEAVRTAIEPDNVGFPEGQSLEVRGVDGGLCFDFQGLDDMGGLVRTIDEVLEHIQVALKAIEQC